jgi:hypothetical protein
VQHGWSLPWQSYSEAAKPIPPPSANGSWQKVSELAFEVDNEGTAIRGVVPPDGPGAALQTLAVNCPSR